MLIFDDQQVEIECPVAPSLRTTPSRTILDIDAGLKERLGRQVGFKEADGVQEPAVRCAATHGRAGPETRRLDQSDSGVMGEALKTEADPSCPAPDTAAEADGDACTARRRSC